MTIGFYAHLEFAEEKTMNEVTIEDLAGSIKVLERKCRRQSWIILAILVVGAALGLSQTVFKSRADVIDADKILRARGLSIVDERGTERVFIGAPVREPLVLGKRFPRGGRMSGVILFDEDGTERSGYCTSDGYPNVLFTLDAIGRQHALFMAEPQGSTAFWIWNGDSSFKMNVDEDEASLKLSAKGKTILEAPAANPAPKGGAK
jgi:hypothetical protein